MTEKLPGNTDHLPDWIDPAEFSHYGKTIPENLHAGLRRYAIERIQPGHFLTYVLQNDLANACGRADPEAASALPVIVAFIYNHLPGKAWGSARKVSAWIEKK